MPLKAVAFDVDGTLYPNPSMYLKSLPMAMVNLRLLKALEDVRGDLRRRPDTSEDFHRVQAQRVAARLGLTPERAYALIEGRVYTRWFKVFQTMKPFPALVETMEAFRVAGLQIAVLSDFPIRNRLHDLGLPGPWACAFSSEETGYLKPNPQAFQAMADRLALHPSEILYVGNSYSYDVLGAWAAGMPSAHLTRRPRRESQATFSFSHYSQLREFVLRCLDESPSDDQSGRVPC